MIDEKKEKYGKELLDLLFESLNISCYQLSKDEENLIVFCSVIDIGYPLILEFHILPKVEHILVQSNLYLKVPPHRHKAINMATCIASHVICDGCFFLDSDENTIRYRLTYDYSNGPVGQKAIQYMLQASIVNIEDFTEKFKFIIENKVSINEMCALLIDDEII